ncbi:PREDICTED: uncharacterized protein LOC104803910 [Tarenaya hassleriana]|uniref:uncharacterized protein LOC104803910 n=1 Tax=Tarenaya hassleriana TaxID=28532 RepID=UPI00053C0B6F|nr:PREDICTED: uncharacterized protein LOC104803910 [Tarenaya hassleriana]
MVELMKSAGNLRPEPETVSKCRNEFPVKLEIAEDFLEEEHGVPNKRPKVSPSLHQESCSKSIGTSAFPVQPAQYNPLDEPSPLGLSLRKSPSLADLIQMRLAQGSGPNSVPIDSKKDSKLAAAPGTGPSPGAAEKLKASNFPASLLRIGQWEYKSRYEGDLVAKCYFAKHKLVWEVLEHGLKSKIEIQWSDIMALKANCPDDEPGTLTLVLARQPLFFRETNPQPRKHTLWQATSDFTDGQASTHRQHFLQCPQGLLNKHFEKLIQCDHRLFHLSRQPEIIVDSPYFEARQSIFEDPAETKGHIFGQLELGKGPSISGSQSLASPVAAQSSSEHVSQDAPSPSSVIDARANESGAAEAVDSRNTRDWDQIKVPGLRQSISVSNFMNHLEQCLSDPARGNESERKEILDIAQLLFSETQFTTLSDEKSLMTRVNSLCCLLQKDGTAAGNSQLNEESSVGCPDTGKFSQPNDLRKGLRDNENRDEHKVSDPEATGASSSKPPGIPRIDSYNEILLQLPRIASLPQFLPFITGEDGDAHNR